MEVSHLIRELINFTIVAFKRKKIEPGVSTDDLIDGDHWPELTAVDLFDIQDTFGFDSLDDLIETLREHMDLLAFLNEADSLSDLDHDLALLASSLTYREFADPGHKVADSPRVRYFLKSLKKSDLPYADQQLDLESLMVKFSYDIFKPIEDELTWINLAFKRGIVVSG